MNYGYRREVYIMHSRHQAVRTVHYFGQFPTDTAMTYIQLCMQLHSPPLIGINISDSKLLHIQTREDKNDKIIYEARSDKTQISYYT